MAISRSGNARLDSVERVKIQFHWFWMCGVGVDNRLSRFKMWVIVQVSCQGWKNRSENQ